MPTLKPTGHRTPPASYSTDQLLQRRSEQARRAIKEGFAVESNLRRIKRQFSGKDNALSFLREAGIKLDPIQHLIDTVWPPRAVTVTAEVTSDTLPTSNLD